MCACTSSTSCQRRRRSGGARCVSADHSRVVARTETGDRAELEDLPEDLAFWNEVSATADTCLGTECPRYDDCFVTRMRQRAAESDVVIVNHHLLCADASVRQNAYGEVIPSCSRAIIDEAHQLEDVATQYFGFSVSNYRFEELARDVQRVAGSGAIDDRDAGRRSTKRSPVYAITPRASSPRSRSRIAATGARKRKNGCAPRPNRSARRSTRRRTSRARSTCSNRRLAVAAGRSTRRHASRSDDGEADDLDERARTPGSARRAGELRTELRFLLRAGDDDYVFFVEFRGRGVFLRASPIDVSAIVRELLLDRMRTTILTSATLTVDGAFDYIRDAAWHRRRRRGASPLGVRLRAAGDPVPAAAHARSARRPIRGGGRTRGDRNPEADARAARSCSSPATRRCAPCRRLRRWRSTIRSSPQGTAPRSQLLDQFRQTPHAVLFATSSFWQGVDVVGEALSCVIIDKLPFASPGDPITAARIDAIRARGGDPFGEYQVPLAILALQQGLGRLIRHRRTAASWRCWIRASGPRDTAGGSSPRCRPRRSFTISRESTRFFLPDRHSL